MDSYQALVAQISDDITRLQCLGIKPEEIARVRLSPRSLLTLEWGMSQYMVTCAPDSEPKFCGYPIARDPTIESFSIEIKMNSEKG